MAKHCVLEEKSHKDQNYSLLSVEDIPPFIVPLEQPLLPYR
jgi:hypothetical protein